MNHSRKSGLIARLLGWMTLPSYETLLRTAVEEVVPEYLSEFGIISIDPEDVPNGFGRLVRLEYCSVHVFYEKMELGIYINSPTDGLYDSRGGTRATVINRSRAEFSQRVGAELENQMHELVERYRPALGGDFSGLPGSNF